MKGSTFSITVPQSIRDALEKDGKKLGTSRSAVARMIILQYYESPKKESSNASTSDSVQAENSR